MKKILFLLLFSVLLFSCSQDSNDDAVQVNNYIEINGVRHQIDKFYIKGCDFGIGSLNDNTYIEVVYTDWYNGFYEPQFDRKVYFAEILDEVEGIYVYNNGKQCNFSNFSNTSYYYISKEKDGTYLVEVVIQSPNDKLLLKYNGKFV